MRTNVTKTVYALFAVLLVFGSCKKEEENLEVGFSQEIENFVPDSTIEKMRDLGMVINEGKQPPSIEGTYLVSPMIMKSSNVSNEPYEIGHKFVDYELDFYEQDNVNLTIKLDTKGIGSSNNIISETIGEGSFISGYNETFSVFTIEDGYLLKSTYDTAYFKTLAVTSGRITADGIKDYHEAIWMLDDYEDPYRTLIPINSGRVFIDSDSLATNVFHQTKSGVIRKHANTKESRL